MDAFDQPRDIGEGDRWGGEHQPKPTKKCRVCGEPAIAFNFGGLCCESCKVFFRRHVFANTKRRTCSRDMKCVIDAKTRRFCSACRFQKCLSIGMKVEVLMKYKDRQKLRQAEKSGQVSMATPSRTEEMVRPLSPYEQHCVEQVNQASARCFGNEADVPLVGEFTSLIEAINIIEVYVSKYVDFGRCFEPFRSMPSLEQVVMLKRIFLNAFAIRKALDLDRDRKGAAFFQNEDCSSCLFCPYASLLGSMIDQELIERSYQHMEQLQDEYEQDGTMLNLLHMSMFYEVSGAEAAERCCEYLLYYHHFYRHLLRRYLATKYRSNQRAQAKMARLTKAVNLFVEHVNLVKTRLVGVVDRSQISHLTVEILDLV